VPIVRQSERIEIYKEALKRLIAAGLAYPCTCSRRELAEAALAPHECAGGGVSRRSELSPAHSGP
jgi:glutamyl/glutaminyl-tRNA synthetase